MTQPLRLISVHPAKLLGAAETMEQWDVSLGQETNTGTAQSRSDQLTNHKSQ